MGFWKRTADRINHFDLATDLTIALNPSIRRVRKLDERGVKANGVITGVRFSLDGDTTRKEFAITVLEGPDAGRYGIRTQPPVAHRLRLGVPVVLKVERGRGVIDWRAMADAWGLEGGSLAQESMRTPPDDGVVDTSIDARVKRNLQRWTPTQAVITSLERRSVMGMPTLNWNIELDVADRGRALSQSDEIPTYAYWYAAPGAVVPAVVDPADAGKASIDWAAFAVAQFDQVGFDDDPPEGSVAAEIERTLGTGSRAAGVGAAPPPSPPPGPAAPPTLDGTMQSWVEMVVAGQMRQRDFERAIADWQSAGMCTAAQADAARRAAGT